MATNFKPLIIVSSLVVLGLAGVYVYKTKFKKKEDEADTKDAEKPSTATLPQAPIGQTNIIKPTPTAPKVVKPMANPKVPVPSPPRTNPGFNPVPKNVPKTVAAVQPKMGANLYSVNGVNAYKTPVASQTGIYKFYKKDAFVGTYLGMADKTFAKVIVEEPLVKNGTILRKNVTVYFKATEIYTK